MLLNVMISKCYPHLSTPWPVWSHYSVPDLGIQDPRGQDRGAFIQLRFSAYVADRGSFRASDSMKFMWHHPWPVVIYNSPKNHWVTASNTAAVWQVHEKLQKRFDTRAEQYWTLIAQTPTLPHNSTPTGTGWTSATLRTLPADLHAIYFLWHHWLY